MTKINDPANLNGRLFGYELKYNNPANTTFAVSRYNGNIAEVDWKTTNDDLLKRYSYSYDSLNRLNYGHYSEPGSTVPMEDHFGESMEYDLNGNITRLYRNAKNTTNGMAMQIDNLTYDYSGNSLLSVTDASQNYSGYPDTSGNPIQYDLNGNMTLHKDKGILGVEYNHLNLPSHLLYDKGLSTRLGVIRENTSYVYRADGVKVGKVYKYAPFDPLGVITKLSEKITDYLDGFQYEGAVGKEVGLIPFGLKFVPTAEGYYNFENNKYIYNYIDHLGNVRLSYMKNVNGSGTEIIEENNYYPFGLKHEGVNILNGNPAYNYKYNGKELQTENGMYDYGARFYMPDLGRWGVMDELAEKSRRFSPYTYALDNPIMFVDPDGREAEQCCSWKDVKSFGRGLLNGTKGIVNGLVQSNTGSVLVNAKKEWTKVYNAYQTGGAKAAGNQYLNSLYETSGAKSIVQTAKGVKNGDPEAIGSAVALTAAAVATHKVAKGSKGAVAAEAESTNLINAKSTAPQVGEAFQSLGVSINDGNISVGGRAVTNGRFDFVVTESGELKIGSGHYYLSGGANEVQAAGQLRLYKGQVMEINNASGHYQPSAVEAKSFPSTLSNMGVDVSKAKLKTYTVD
jgi:RHS repeat-associated protein